MIHQQYTPELAIVTAISIMTKIELGGATEGDESTLETLDEICQDARAGFAPSEFGCEFIYFLSKKYGVKS